MASNTSQTFNQDVLGSSIIAGEGVAGTPTGGVLSVQGLTNGTAIPVIDPLDATLSSINITTLDLVSSSATGFAGQLLITGTPTAGSAASYAVNSIQTAMILIGGTWTGTLSTEVSEDGGVTWEARSIHVIGTSTFASAVTANVAGSMNAAGKSNIRIRAISAITGTATVKVVTSDNPSNFYIANSLKIVDGSSTPNLNMLTIKAGSVLSLSTDTAAVVTLRDTVTVQGPSGSAGTPSGGILTIQGVTGGTAINVNEAKVPLTPSAPTATSVGITSASALAANTNRKGLVMTNTSINTISLNIVGGTAVLNSGITLYPGGHWYMDEFTFTTSAIFAIASAAASNLAIQEQS